MKTTFKIWQCFFTLLLLFAISGVISAQNSPSANSASTPNALFEGSFSVRSQVVPSLPTDRILTESRKRLNETGVIFQTNFAVEHDLNEDGHPDGWKRFEGVNYPKYLEMGIVTQRTTLSDQFFQIQMQRGKATVFSPAVRVCPGLSYSASTYVFVSQLQHDRVFLSLSLLDQEGNILRTTFSEMTGNTNGWFPLATEALIADTAEAYYVSLGFHVDHPNEKQDLQGQISFTQVQITEEPVVRFNMSQPWNMYHVGQPILIEGTVSMIHPAVEPATILLKDPFDTILQSDQKILYRPEPTSSRQQTEDSSSSPVLQGDEVLPETVTFPFRWEQQEAIPGFYRLSLSVPSHKSPIIGQMPANAYGETVFVVLPPHDDASGGFYGLTLPDHLSPSKISDCRPLIENSGIRYLKFPVWLAEKSNPSDFDAIVGFCSWLTDQNIDAVGVLCNPPESVRRQVGNDVTALNLFSLPMSAWYPSMERNMFHFGMVIPNWQLGSDHDLSMSRMSALPQLVEDVDAELEKKGLDIMLGLPWNWVFPFPGGSGDAVPVNWGFLSLGNEFDLTEKDLEYFLNATQRHGVRRYVSMDAIHAEQYPLEERIRDLVLKMAVGKQFGADAVFLSTPIDKQKGLYHNDQKPTELFLPWRTTACLLGIKSPTSPIVMPGKSRNFCFRDHTRNKDCLLIWNDVSKVEAMNFGPQAKVVDVWGRESLLSRTNFRQSVQVGPLPIFVVDAESEIMQIRQNLILENRDIPSDYGKKLPNKLILANPFDYPLMGRIEVVPPRGIVVDPAEFNLSVLPGETVEKEITLMLTPSAMSGESLWETIVKLQNWDYQNFSVYDFLHVGSHDIGLEITTFVNRHGQLEVLQAFVNNTDEEVSFSCTLYVPERPMRTMTINKAGFGRHDATYFVENANDLIGKPARVVATEIGGDRVLKYQFTIGE